MFGAQPVGGNLYETTVSILSSALSVLALCFSYVSFRRSHRTGIRPVLIFSNDAFDEACTTTWFVENAGNGPALNVVLCGGVSLAELDLRDAVVIPSLAKGSKERLGFIAQRVALVAKYSDIHGAKYTSTCFDNTNRLFERDKYPRLQPKRALFQIRATNKNVPDDTPRPPASP